MKLVLRGAVSARWKINSLRFNLFVMWMNKMAKRHELISGQSLRVHLLQITQTSLIYLKWYKPKYYRQNATNGFDCDNYTKCWKHSRLCWMNIKPCPICLFRNSWLVWKTSSEIQRSPSPRDLADPMLVDFFFWLVGLIKAWRLNLNVQ